MDEALLERAFAALGLDFRSLFPTLGAYEAHEWIVKSVPGFGTIVNAVPPEAKIRSLPWEEWYVRDGTCFHHVLSLTKPPTYDEIFQAPKRDDIHPQRTLGRSWYVIDDSDMSPKLLRPR